MGTARLPELTPPQRRLVNEIHSYWRRERRFPRTVALSVRLRKDLDVRAVAKSMPPDLIGRANAHSDDEEVLKLQILGLALCSGEDRIVDAFLELLRDAARQAISAPNSRPVVTRTMLRGVLKDVPQDEFDLVAPVVRDSLRWGGTEPNTGEWMREPSLDVIRFENVQTMGEYRELASAEPREVAVLGQQHIALLGEVYHQWCKGGVWPGSREFIVGYRGKGDALRLLSEIPTRYRTGVQWSSMESTRFSLTLDGLAFSGRADADLAAFVAMVHILVEQLETSPEDALITIPELARRASVSEPTAKRMAEVMANEWGLGLSLGHDDSRSTMRVRDTILTYEGIRTFEDFMSRREDRARSNEWCENNELEDAAIRKGILEVFADLPEDGSRHLNRSNVLGRAMQPGSLEHHLNHTFTIEERGRADRLMRQLEAEGVLVPTWRDIAAPADWLIITGPGREVLRQGLASSRESLAQAQDHEFDAFLCHASEDKAAVVTPFAALMEKNGLRPWLDAGHIGWGDSLVKTIERGLTHSRFVIVFVSERSLGKSWPERELQTALNLEISGSKKVLPVILGIEHASVEEKHPFLAEKRYLTIQPYDPSGRVAAEDLQRLLDALKVELSKLAG